MDCAFLSVAVFAVVAAIAAALALVVILVGVHEVIVFSVIGKIML